MNNKVMISIGAILVLVIAAQAYYTYYLSRQVQSLQGQHVVEVPPPSSTPPDPLPQVLPRLPEPFRDLDPLRDDWNPFEEMQRMQNEMNKIFGDMRSQLQQHPDLDGLNRNFTFAPNVDVKEEKERYVVTVDIPGADESNIGVTLEGNQLQISATTQKSTAQENKNNGGDMLRSERFYGQFKRTITLPSPVVAEKMHTDYKNGVLTITVPKK
ncbi:Hsp20/alpha crystallin family protein [Kaarinaea lacus]